MSNTEHYRAVDEFMARMKQERPEDYERICREFPVITAKMQRRIWKSEERLNRLLSRELGYDSTFDGAYGDYDN